MINAKAPDQAATIAIEQAFKQAIECHQAGQLQSAENLYTAILKILPYHSEANHNMGLLAVQRNHPEDSLPYFNKALDAEPSRRQYWLSYIDALYRSAQLEDARQILALAQQQGLQGNEVDALAIRLQDVAGSRLESLQEFVESDSSSQTPQTPQQDNEHIHNPEPKSKHPAIYSAGSSRKKIKGPSQKEINALFKLFNQSKFSEAANIALQMTIRYPLHGGGWKVLGAALMNMGRYSDALAAMQKASELSPGDAETHNNLGSTLLNLNKFSEAGTCYKRALQINPDYVSALCNLGVAQHKIGSLDEAEISYRKALRINPRYVTALINLGAVLQGSAKLEQAMECHLQALKSQPNNPDARYNMSITLNDLSRFGEAEMECRCVLLGNPDYAAAHNHLGSILRNQGRLVDAELAYRQAIKIQPDFADAHINLGKTLHDLNLFEAAVESCRRAIQLDPNHAEAYNNLGSSLKVLGNIDEAEINYAKALQINPDLAEGLVNRGSALLNLGDLIEAETCFRRALKTKPDFFEARSNLLFCLSQNSTIDAQTLFSEHCQFGTELESKFPSDYLKYENSCDPDRCLQIGFVSGDFRGHALASFIEPLLAHLSGSTQLLLHAYSNHRNDDATTDRLKRYFSQWNSIASMPDDELAAKILADQIDILIDLSGHTAKNRLATFARKPAPIQASWMGYPGTTGMSTMDYYFSDRHILPAGVFENLFTEKIIRLPANAPFLPSTWAPQIGALPAISNGHITFGSFNRLFKLSREVIALWTQLLRALPDSRMVLAGMPEEGKTENLIKWFAQEGIARERLELYPRSSMDIYMQLHHKVDICLDTFPYNGGTTTLHALWMGVPTLTLSGMSVASRTGAGILGQLGLESFIADDSTDFVRKGLFLAASTEELSSIRSGLRERFAKSATGHPELIAAGLEKAMRIMWQRWCAGLPAESFEVDGQNASGKMTGSIK